MNISYFLLILFNTFILVSGQFLWKLGLEKETISFNSLGVIIKLMFSPFIFSGILTYGLATVLWLFILSKVQISIAYPIQSLAYIIAVFGAYFIFNEPLTLYKFLGCLLIMGGVSLIAFSN
jgi:drug/metabolite transporter (DMT)-like permease